jgi:hypothetical protein
MTVDPGELGNITCPACTHESREPMPHNACLYFFQCPGCGTLLRPKRGDCCVFCSYGDRACPPWMESWRSLTV